MQITMFANTLLGAASAVGGRLRSLAYTALWTIAPHPIRRANPAARPLPRLHSVLLQVTPMMMRA